MSGKTRGNKSKTPEVSKDLWNTDWRAVRDAEILVGKRFSLDVAATDARTAKAPTFITPEQDALKTPWLAGNGAIWCNPPFTMKPQFLTRAHEQARIWQREVMVMLPYEPATQWWREYVSGKATATFVPNGRYDYLHPDTKKIIPGVNFVSAFLLFTPLKMPTQYVEFNRWIGDHLMLPDQYAEREKVTKKIIKRKVK